MLLASAGSDVLTQLDRFKDSFLWAAAKGGRVEECEMLLQMGTDVNWVSAEGDTPLLAACRNGHTAAALCLLDHGAEVNAAAATDGQTALHLSCRKGDETVAETLLQTGADPSAVDNGGSKAFERLGAHVPTGMLRRLKLVAQRRRQNHEVTDPSLNTTTTIPSSDDTNSARGTDALSTLGRRPESKESRHRCHQHTAGVVPGAVSRSGAGGALGSRNAALNNRSPAGPERQNSSRRARRAQGDEGGERERATEGLRREDIASVAGIERTGTGAHNMDHRTTFPAITPATTPASSRRGSPAEPAPSSRRGRGCSRGAQSTEVDGSSNVVEDNRQHLRPSGREELHDFERDDNVSQSEDGESSSEGRLSSDDDEEEIFERGRCPVASPSLDGDDFFDFQHVERANNFLSRSGGSSEPALARLLARDIPASRTAAAIAAAIAAAASSPGRAALERSEFSMIPDGSATDAQLVPQQRRQQRQLQHQLRHQSLLDPAAHWEGRRASSATAVDGGVRDHAASSGAIDSSSGRSRGFYFGTTGATPQIPTSRVQQPTTGFATESCAVSGFGNSLVIIPGRPRAMPSTGVEERGQREWATRITGASTMQGEAPYSGQSSGSPAEAGRAKGEGLRQGSGFGIPAAERDAANDHVSLIRTLWLQEKETRLAAEAKAEAVREQSARLWNELVRSEKQVLSLEEASDRVRKERDKLKATLRGEGIKGRSLQELEQLEKELRKALEGVCVERDRIVQEQLAKEEQRLCVVCQEKERGVLLLPCRHLCVCKGCSERRELTLCPLCRDSIAERLVVYS